MHGLDVGTVFLGTMIPVLFYLFLVGMSREIKIVDMPLEDFLTFSFIMGVMSFFAVYYLMKRYAQGVITFDQLTQFCIWLFFASPFSMYVLNVIFHPNRELAAEE